MLTFRRYITLFEDRLDYYKEVKKYPELEHFIRSNE